VFHPSAIYTDTKQEWIMPQCNNCEGFVTDAYVRVFAPPGMTAVRVCPRCENLVREGADIRKAHAPRR